MLDTRFKLILSAVVFLLILSAFLPLVPVFGGGTTAFAASPIDKEGEVRPLSPMTGVEQEMRGIWITTVNNINFPSKQKLSADKLAAELDAIVAFSKENGFNTILFQVRPAADALYKSDIFPASKFVSGTAGAAPDGDFDCLGYLLEKAHAENIEVYAWVNPLRVTSGNATYPQTDLSALPASSPAAAHPDWVVPYADGKLYFDAGIPAVRELVASGVREICEKYDVDGIIFDDYFYPYPSGDAEFDDAATFAAYGENFEEIADFRRDNINRMVELCYRTVKAVDTDIRFGVSPFGIWQNSDGENGGSATSGLSAYDAIYCDALAWAKGGYVDFIAPQLYWTFTTEAAPYGRLADWWSRALDGTGVMLYINHGVYRYADGGMQSGEICEQVTHARELYAYRGSLYYGYAALVGNAGEILGELDSLFANEILYFDYADGGRLTVDSYADGDTTSSATALISGKSNPAYPISVNGITPLRGKDGGYSITLALKVGLNRITVANGEQTIELFLQRTEEIY
ncbi:MAG: family 10 glycosylhydrolase [Clostridia bacterium]|nr:family 10 glycosylhydrolase [Clostridia bacterium]